MDEGTGGVVRYLAAVGVALAVLGAACGTALGFGSWNILGQHAEHERITRAGMACGGFQADPATCLQPNTADNAAGTDGFLGGVGAPDALVETLRGPAAKHCDDGDHLPAAGYPQGEAEARAQIVACGLRREGYLRAAVAMAGGLVGADGRLNVQAVFIPPATAARRGRCDIDVDPGFQDGSTPGGGDLKCRVLVAIGRALHVTQDFYSHSNWADAAAPGDLGIANPPGLTRTTDFWRFPFGEAELAAAVAGAPGLITGCDDSLTKGRCAGRVAHSRLNKDDGTRAIDPSSADLPAGTSPRGQVGVGASDGFRTAVRAAAASTATTWADVVRELRRAYGEARGTAIVEAIRRDAPWSGCARVGGSAARALFPPAGASSSARSVDVRLVNGLGAPLRCALADLSGGEWASMPPGAVAGGASAAFRSQSNGFATGTEGRVTYAVGGESPLAGLEVTATWDNPYVGSNGYGCTVTRGGRPAGQVACAFARASGNSASITFTLRRTGGDHVARAEAARAPRRAVRRGRAAPGEVTGLRDCPQGDEAGLQVDDVACDRALALLERAGEDRAWCPDGWAADVGGAGRAAALRDAGLDLPAGWAARVRPGSPVVVCLRTQDGAPAGSDARQAAFAYLAGAEPGTDHDRPPDPGDEALSPGQRAALPDEVALRPCPAGDGIELAVAGLGCADALDALLAAQAAGDGVCPPGWALRVLPTEAAERAADLPDRIDAEGAGVAQCVDEASLGADAGPGDVRVIVLHPGHRTAAARDAP